MTFKRPDTYRNKVNNTRLTKQMFWDNYVNIYEAGRSETPPLFTLHHDVEGYTNFRTEYISDEDKTGYTTAMRLLENFDHFQLLMKSPWFVEAKQKWDEEIDALVTARALRALKNILEDPNTKPSERTAAARELLKRSEAGGSTTAVKRKGAGRPTKEEVEGHLKKQAEKESTVLMDIKRITERGN